MYRKSARLTPVSYVGVKVHFITICCNNRLAHLQVPATANRVIEILLESAAKDFFELHAYCAMRLATTQTCPPWYVSISRSSFY